MEEFQFETKIREIVYQLSQPTMMRLSDCLRQLETQQQNIDNLKQQVRQLNENQQNHQIDANRKYGEVDSLQRQLKKLEQDVQKNVTSSQQYSTHLKTRLDTIDQDFEQHKNNSQFVINSQLKTQQELDQLAKKQAENTETFNKKIDEFFKDYYTFFVDSRNQVNKISKEQQLLLKDVQRQGNQLESLGSFREAQQQQNSSLQQRVEWISNEISQLVNKDFFRFAVDKEEKQRIEDNQYIKSIVQQLQSQLSIYNISFDERMKGFELYEIQYRQQLIGFQQQLNSTVETYQLFYKETTEQLSNQNSVIKVIDEYQTNCQDKIQMVVNAQVNVVSTNLNNQIAKLKESFTLLKSTIAKEMGTEFNYKLEDIRQMLLNETSKQVSIKLSTIESQIAELKNQTVTRDVGIQVIIDENSISQQEQLQQYIIDQIEVRLANTTTKFSNKPIVRRNSIIQPSLPTEGNSNKSPDQKGFDTSKLSLMNNCINDSLEDIKTDIQLLFEMKEELEEKLKVFEVDFSVGMQNFDRNHSQVLKLKSDIFNDTEYLNSQIKILFREKEISNKKFNYLLQILAGETESTQIIISLLLKQIRDPIKFTSDLGTVFEFRNDVCNYRQSTYQLEDLIKKAFQSLIELWDKNELLEVREYNPLWYFGKFIGKQPSGLSKTLDKSLERTIKCTTQTLVDAEDSIRRSGRQRNISQKQQSIIYNMDSTRQKRMTVRSMFKQQDREDSNEGLPKVIKK